MMDVGGLRQTRVFSPGPLESAGAQAWEVVQLLREGPNSDALRLIF